jgi:two-component system OmpR family response regulator
MPRILTIEDDETTSAEVECVADGAEGLRLGLGGGFDAITLDRMLPSLDGLAVAAGLKGQGVDTPILMISAIDQVDERVRGLRAGGDDYLTKPFSPAEMVARIEVLLRRRRADAEKLTLRLGDLELDLVAQVARRRGKDLRLASKELKLLELFVRNAGQILTRTMIFERVWGYNFDPGTNLIEVHVRGLRNKLELPGTGPLLHTVRSKGYVLRGE